MKAGPSPGKTGLVGMSSGGVAPSASSSKMADWQIVTIVVVPIAFGILLLVAYCTFQRGRQRRRFNIPCKVNTFSFCCSSRTTSVLDLWNHKCCKRQPRALLIATTASCLHEIILILVLYTFLRSAWCGPWIGRLACRCRALCHSQAWWKVAEPG